MIFDQFVLVFRAHTVQWVEFTLKVSLEGVACLDDLLHDLESLLLGDAWTEWIVGEVSSNSDSGGVNHGLLLGSEVGVLKAVGVHVRDVLVIWLVAVVVLNDLVEQLVESVIGIVRSGVDSDTRILVSNTREDAHFE